MKPKLILIIFSLLIFAQKTFGGAASEVLKQKGKDTVVGGATAWGVSKALDQAPSLTPFRQKLGSFMSNPPGIMILSSIATLNAGILYSAAEEQETESEQNIAKIEKLLAVYKDSWFDYCPNGRENLNEPNCYCYSEDGKQNPNRTKSQICVSLWEKNSKKISAAAGNYNGIAAKNDPVGCVTTNGEFDENCKCKKFLNPQGQNACMKSISLNANNNPLGLAYLNTSGFDKVAKALVAQTSGQSMLANLNPNMLAAAIAKQGDMNNGIFTRIANDPTKKKYKVFNDDNEILKAQNGVFSKSDIAHASSAIGSSASSMIGGNQPEGAATNLLKEAAAKAGLDMVGSGRGLQNKKAENKEGMNFNLATENASTAGQVQSFPEMEKNYNYKDSDISKNSDSNLFDIISNRYIQSGLKRLFDN